jgi:hypothetical protein
MRRMETLLDANRALTSDLPTGFLKRDHWLAAGKLLVHASETGSERDVKKALMNWSRRSRVKAG